MTVVYVADQGAALRKKGNRLVIEKKGQQLQWVHAFKLEQIVLMGNISITPGALHFLLREGIDTVFLSMNGKYRGRLMTQFGKNVLLRQAQFRFFDDDLASLELAKAYVHGKLANYRTLLRKHNRELKKESLEEAVHGLRYLLGKAESAADYDSLRGIEGKATAIYFKGFGHAIRSHELTWKGRSRRPPRDPVNALLSFGYTLLANTVQMAVHIVGLDPYLGSLHAVDYGRPSLVLDLMEEFRPVLVDSLILRLINLRQITLKDFYFQTDVPHMTDEEELEEVRPEDMPVLIKAEGIKKLIANYEGRLEERVFHMRAQRQLKYRDVCLEQCRLLVRHIKGEDTYEPFLIR